MINVKTGSSHYKQLCVMTSYHGIIDYHSNKVVIITSVMKNLYGDFSTVTIPSQKTLKCNCRIGRFDRISQGIVTIFVVVLFIV